MTAARRAALAAALASVAAAAGCRQVLGIDERNEGPTELTAGNFARATARAYCEGLEPCCLDQSFGFDEATCENVLIGGAQQIASAVLALGLPFDPAAAAACVRAQAALARACIISEEQDAAADAACARVYRGRKAPGELCRLALECAIGPGETASCTPGDDGPERCRTVRRGAEGESCAEGDGARLVACERRDGLRCDAVTLRCVRLAGPGEPCVSAPDCADDLFCKQGQCAPRVGVGGACTPEQQSCDGPTCLKDACAAGLRCDPSGRACVEALPLRAACGDAVECASGSCSDGACEPIGLLASAGICGGPRR